MKKTFLFYLGIKYCLSQIGLLYYNKYTKNMDFNKIIEGVCGNEAALNFVNHIVKFVILKKSSNQIMNDQNYVSILENTCKNYV